MHGVAQPKLDAWPLQAGKLPRAPQILTKKIPSAIKHAPPFCKPAPATGSLTLAFCSGAIVTIGLP
jgi:hypothetical protein